MRLIRKTCKHRVEFLKTFLSSLKIALLRADQIEMLHMPVNLQISRSLIASSFLNIFDTEF